MEQTRQLTECEKVFGSHFSNKVLTCRLQKEQEQLKSKLPINRWVNELNKGFSSDKIKWSTNMFY